MIFKELKILQEWNQRGWIPGPSEEKKAFEKRVEALHHFFSYPPEEIDHFLTDRDWIEAQETTLHFYDFSPDWIVSHYSNRNLSFFQGAATWITEKGGYCIPLIQLREKLERGNLLGLYSKAEVLAHEAVHAVRMQFDEPYYEEIFAYKTSPHFFRRFFGPLFQKPWEAYLFLFLFLLPLAIEVIQVFDVELEHFSLFRFLPLVFFAYLLCRLLCLCSLLGLALRRMRKFLKDSKKPWALAVRLKDREIFRFALQRGKSLEKYFQKQDSFRWTFLKEIYFKK